MLILNRFVRRKGLWCIAMLLMPLVLGACGGNTQKTAELPAVAPVPSVAPSSTVAPVASSTPNLAPTAEPTATSAPTIPPTMERTATSMPTVEPTPDMMDVGGHRLFVDCKGTGSPTVILDAGLGVQSGTWYLVHPAVATFTRVCRYDRAGLGLSTEAGPTPRTSKIMVDELRTLLNSLHLSPPYVLVGHSLGGLNMQLFASTYPDEVAGLVLVDAIHPDLDRRIEALVPQDLAQERRDELELNQEQIKFEDILASAAQVRDAGPLPDVPLRVLRHGIPFDMSPGWPSDRVEELWIELQTDLSQRTSHGKLIVGETSGHRIQETQPDLVTEAIREVVEEVRGQ